MLFQTTAAHSAASNQPSGLLLRVTGCGSQHPPRALGGTCVLLAAAPTTPPCIGHRPQSSLLQVPMVRNVYRGSCGSKDFMAFLFCKPWVHGFCTVFARFQNVQRVQIVAKSDKECRNSKLKTCDVSLRNDDKT